MHTSGNELTNIPHWVFIVVSVVITAIIDFAIKNIFEKRAKLVCYYDHVGSHTIKGDSKDICLNTHVLAIVNQGKLVAEGIKVNHYKIPESLDFPDIDVRPSIDYKLVELTDGTKELRVPKLVKGEKITISYIYTNALMATNIDSGVKFDGGYAKFIPVMPTRVYPKWVRAVLFVLIWLGAFTLIYWLLRFVVLIYTLL